MNPYIARVSGEAFDADQVEHDGYDPFFISADDIAREKARDERLIKRAERIASGKTWARVARDMRSEVVL